MNTNKSYSDVTPLRELLADDSIRDKVEKYFPGIYEQQGLDMAKNIAIGTIFRMAGSTMKMTEERYQEFLDEINNVVRETAVKTVIPFKWLFVGSGNIAKLAAMNIDKVEGQSVVGVFSPNFNNASAFGKMFSCPAYRTLGEALKSGNYDGIYIASFHNVHWDNIVECVAANKPILCEKPLTTDAKIAAKIFELGREHNIYLAEAMWTWYCNTANKVKYWIDSGYIGKIERVEMRYTNGTMLSSSSMWGDRLLNSDKAGGALLDIGVYPLYYCYRLLGKPDSINCIGELYNGVDISSNVTLNYPDDVVCNVEISFNDYKGESAVIYGSDGRIEVPNFHSATTATMYRYKVGIETFEDIGATSFNLLGQQFLRAAEEITAGVLDSQYAPSIATIETHAIIDECRRQLGVVYPFEK